MRLDKMTLKERLQEWKTFAQSDCDFVLFNEDVNEVLELYEKQEEQTKRSEKEILKDFEKLGYYLSSKKEGFLYNRIILSNKNIKGLEIHISFSMKSYAKYEQGLCITITMQEHKLLHELFECWEWI